MTNHISGYASSIYEMAKAEGQLDSVRSELPAVAATISSNQQLNSALTNNLLPSSQRTQAIDELLEGKVSKSTKAAVAMIISADRASDISEIATALSAKTAQSSGRKLAVVKSAVALTQDQQSRLAIALAKSVGSEVEINNIVDPDVVGGVVTTIDDTVIDGSVRSSLNKMREAL